MPHLKPVGAQSTNWIVRFVLIVATAAFTSFGTTSPRYIMQHAMYLPWRGSHLTSSQSCLRCFALSCSQHFQMQRSTDPDKHTKHPRFSIFDRYDA